jgi:D-beta-D-heptose 7-phosphate kinase/D-beta-D-heptose 1-phosphate adenosyltransferase
MNQKRLQSLLNRFSRRKVMVVGDVMLDQFLWGKVSRISPEAPVPVVDIQNESSFPGGAANVARNLRALNTNVRIIGVVGDDPAGLELRSLLQKQQVDTSGLIVDAGRPTTVKTRIVAHSQQIVRYDRERAMPLPAETVERMVDYCRTHLDDVDALIFEDYGKGVLSQSTLDRMNRMARRKGKITTADPTARQPLRFQDMTVITPNRFEAFAAAGLPNTEALDDVLADEPLMQVGAILLKKWRPQNLLVTLGEHGMCLFRSGKKPHHIPTVAQEVFDVSGAGDTVIATLVAALASGASAVEAAEISNHAAGVVVGKVGTATCSPLELVDSFKRVSQPVRRW